MAPIMAARIGLQRWINGTRTQPQDVAAWLSSATRPTKIVIEPGPAK